jgi:tRNA-2-methylthio-N6-dimethylallyladenosine synthase
MGEGITLIGQNVNTYGMGLLANGYVFLLPSQGRCRIKGLERIRYATSHPRDLTRDGGGMSEHKISVPLSTFHTVGSDRVLG